jgi:hypothetical protein
MNDYSKITMPQTEDTKPSNNIIFYNNLGNERVEVLRITKDGITANPDVFVDEAADAVIRALDVYIKNLVNRPWVGLTDEQKHFFSSMLDSKTDFEVFEAIEAALKSNNT